MTLKHEELPLEHLFRDDRGAALEKAALLADENARLRAEIARLRENNNIMMAAAAGRDREAITTRIHPSMSATTPSSPPMLKLVGVTMMFVGLAVALISVARWRVRANEVSFAAPAPMPAAAVRASFTPSSQVPVIITGPNDECSAPFTVDGKGARHYKMECLAEPTSVSAYSPPKHL